MIAPGLDFAIGEADKRATGHLIRNSMAYAHVYWIHDFVDEPTQFFCEIDDEGYELRKVVRYRDGTLAYADATETYGGTFLSPEPFPPLDEPSPDTRFVITEIGAHEFNAMWERRRLSHRTES